MKVQEIREIAQKMGIPAGKLKKADLIRAIQREEGNQECFASGQQERCGQHQCLWTGDCKQ